MTTFTTEDRIIAEKDGSFTVNVSPPHIVDSGASVMDTNHLADRLEEFYTGTHITKAAEVLRRQAEYIRLLEKLCNENGLGIGKDLLTGKVIPFPEE